MGCAERLRGILGMYKRGWQFLYRIVTLEGTGAVADILIIVCFTKRCLQHSGTASALILVCGPNFQCD